MPVASRLNERWKAWVEGGAICTEMEAAAIFVIAGIHRKRAGGVMLMGGADMNADHVPLDGSTGALAELFDVRRAIRVAVEAMKLLTEQDRQSGG
jgi:uridine phosphorylase